VTLAFLAGAVLLQAQSAPSTAARSPNADNGKRLYAAYYCYACHGTVGQGGSAGARLVPDPPGPPRIKYVRNPTGLMPAYTSRVISDEDLADIFAYLRSIPPSPPAARIPLLNQ
jgi:mono/diheme cytochrome c family protein